MDGDWGEDPQDDYKNPYLYTGRRLDSETGLYYYRARYYHPILGRFVPRDPIGYLGAMNLYAYVDGNPLMHTDPKGLDKCPSHKGGPCFKASSLNDDGWNPIWKGTKASTGASYIFGHIDFRYLGKENEKEKCFCKCCKFELWIYELKSEVRLDGELVETEYAYEETAPKK